MSAARSGPLVGAVFGLVFVLANAGALPSLVAALLQGIAFAVFVAIMLTQCHRPGRPAAQVEASGRAFGRSYWIVVAGEVSAIVLGLIVLAGPLDTPQAAVAWISLVVGLHFFALATVWQQPLMRVLGAGIAACGAVGLVLAATGASDAAIAVTAGVVPGVLLLVSSLYGGTRDRRGAGPAIRPNQRDV